MPIFANNFKRSCLDCPCEQASQILSRSLGYMPPNAKNLSKLCGFPFWSRVILTAVTVPNIELNLRKQQLVIRMPE